MRLANWLTFVAALLLPVAASAAEDDRIVESDTLAAAVEAAADLRERHDPSAVLIVFDIDNTLLTATHDFGSDAWYDWQAGLLDHDTLSHLQVGDSFSDLIAVQGLAYALGNMTVTEPETAEIVASLIAAGHPVMALTARGPANRDATRRELVEQGLTFPTAPICQTATAAGETGPALCAARGWIDADHLVQTAEGNSDLSGEELRALTLSPRAISYAEGIMMVSGQNKGLLLRLLLHNSDVDATAVIFVDDGRYNVVNVAAAFPAEGSVELRPVAYTRFDAADAAFLTSEERQRNAAQTWRRISSTLCQDLGTFCGP